MKQIAQLCAQNYYGTQFIGPRWVPILGPSLVTGPSEDWGGKLCGSCESTTSRPQLQHGCQPGHIFVEWVPWVFLTWVKSNLWVRLEPHSRVCHPLRGEMDKILPLIVVVLTVIIVILIFPMNRLGLILKLPI